MIRKNAKVFALVLAIVMMLSTAAFAAEGDHFVNGKLKYSANQVRADVSAKNHVRVAPSEFQIEVEGKLYDLADANAAYAEDKANWKEILKGEDPSEDLKVVEVSAIEAITVTVGDDVDLPETVEVTLNDGNEEEEIEATVVEVAVDWEEFVAEEAGEFDVNGTIVLDEDAEFTISEELAAVTVTVVVEEAALEVIEISAITETVDANADKQMLGFTVNNGKEVTLKELTDAGYTIEFLANKAVFEVSGAAASRSATGELREEALNVDDTFKYQVKISKDGEVVAESELVEVTVQDQANLVTSISAVELYVTQNSKDVEVASGKLATGDTAKVVVMGRTADMAADADDVDVTLKVTLSTDKVAVATVAANGTITQPGAKGDVTITAKAGDITESITVNASNAARTVDATKSTVTPASLELATGDSADIVVALKDQYGDTFVPADDAVQTLVANNADGQPIAAAIETSAVDSEDLTVTLSLTANGTNAGTGKVVVNHSTTKLAEVNLTVKAPGEIDEYKLEAVDKKHEIDLKGKAAGTATLQLFLNGYDEEGLFVAPTIVLAPYSFESSDEDVVTVDTDGLVTAIAPGTAVVKTFLTEDAFETTVAEVTITVKNTTPSIEKVSFKTVEKITDDKTIGIKDILEIAISGKEEVHFAAGEGEDTGKIILKEKDASGVELGKIVLTPVGGESVFTTTNLVVTKGDAAVEGKIYLTVIDSDSNFVDQTEISVKLPGVYTGGKLTLQTWLDPKSITITLAEGHTFKNISSLEINLYSTDSLVGTVKAKSKLFDTVSGSGNSNEVSTVLNSRDSGSWELPDIAYGETERATVIFVMDGVTYYMNAHVATQPE